MNAYSDLILCLIILASVFCVIVMVRNIKEENKINLIMEQGSQELLNYMSFEEEVDLVTRHYNFLGVSEYGKDASRYAENLMNLDEIHANENLCPSFSRFYKCDSLYLPQLYILFKPMAIIGVSIRVSHLEYHKEGYCGTFMSNGDGRSPMKTESTSLDCQNLEPKTKVRMRRFIYDHTDCINKYNSLGFLDLSDYA